MGESPPARLLQPGGMKHPFGWVDCVDAEIFGEITDNSSRAELLLIAEKQLPALEFSSRSKLVQRRKRPAMQGSFCIGKD
jgi:hypothetical protein